MLASRARHGEHLAGDKFMLFHLPLFPGKIRFDIESGLNSQIRHADLLNKVLRLYPSDWACSTMAARTQAKSSNRLG